MTDDPMKKMPAWKACPAYRRVRDCLTMLVLSGAVTYAEAAKARKRIEKWEYKYARSRTNT